MDGSNEPGVRDLTPLSPFSVYRTVISTPAVYRFHRGLGRRGQFFF